MKTGIIDVGGGLRGALLRQRGGMSAPRGWRRVRAISFLGIFYICI